MMIILVANAKPVLDVEISRRAEEDEDAAPSRQPRSAPWHLQSKPSREGAISPPSWDSRRSSGRPAASGSLAVPQEASAQYAAY
jgi:hypothetical protein